MPKAVDTNGLLIKKFLKKIPELKSYYKMD
jgi:hypothetical protein